jgi:hypothetical protein
MAGIEEIVEYVEYVEKVPHMTYLKQLQVFQNFFTALSLQEEVAIITGTESQSTFTDIIEKYLDDVVSQYTALCAPQHQGKLVRNVVA